MKGKKCPFSHTVHIFVKIIYFLNSRWSKVLKTTIWDFSLMNSHIFFKIIILDCKVFKFKRFSSVTRNVSVKHPILNQNLIQKSAKNEKCPPIFFSWVIWAKTNWSYTFSKWISWQISSKWLFQRNVDSDLEKAQTSEPWFLTPSTSLSPPLPLSLPGPVLLPVPSINILFNRRTPGKIACKMSYICLINQVQSIYFNSYTSKDSKIRQQQKLRLSYRRRIFPMPIHQ